MGSHLLNRRALLAAVVLGASACLSYGALAGLEAPSETSGEAPERKAGSLGTIGGTAVHDPELVVPGPPEASWPGGLDSGDCPEPTPLVSGEAIAAPAPRQYYLFDQPTTYWTVVGVRQPAADWDVAVYSNPDGAGPPVCFTGSLALSQLTGVVDLVVGDFNHDAPSRYYTRCYQFSGAADATMEWDDGADELFADGALITGSTGADDVLEIWDLALEQGNEYKFELHVSGGASMKLLLFKNPNDDVYWAPRSWAEFISTGPTQRYACSRTDRYGLILVNENGAAGTYELSVAPCPDTAIALSSGIAVDTPDPGAHYSFDQAQAYWTAVGTRHTAADWDILVYGGDCRSDLVGTSEGSTAVDFVVGDFNHNAAGVHFVDALNTGAPAGAAVTEWDDGADELIVDGGAIALSTDATDVLEVWDVALEAGEAYQFLFQPSGLAELRLFLFRSNGGDYWAERAQREFETTVPINYSAPATDRYGVVVINENGEPGSFELEIRAGTVAVADSPASPAAVTRLSSIAPNPTSGLVRLEFSLTAPGRVAFELVDVTGRVIARTSSYRESGRWTTSWDARAAVGDRLGSGVYWLRMTVGGLQVDTRKLLLID